jgi:mannose-6-phosphate isomerase-like protein (cupin superfamily)
MTDLRYPDVELDGPARAEALARCEAQLAAWDIAVPREFILVLNFGLDEFEHTGLTEYWIANETDAGYCGKFLFLLDGQWCPEHEHRMKHETFYVLRGKVRMIADGAETMLGSGDTFVMPQGVKHKFQGVGPALILEVSQPSIRGDNYFTDTRIGKNGVL